MTDFFRGAHYLFAGFGLLTKPGVKRFVIIPLVINIVLFTCLFMLLQHYMSLLDHWIAGMLPTWLQWLSVVFWLLFFVSCLLVFVYAFAVMGAIAAAPFNGLLAAKVEVYLTGHIPEDHGLVENIRDLPRMLARQFAILGYYLPRAILILLLYFIPIVHLAAIVVWIVFSAWFLTLQYLDFPTDNHRIPLREVRAWLSARRALALGFGLSLMFVMSIPVLNFFAVPAAAAGATLLWLDQNSKGAMSS